MPPAELALQIELERVIRQGAGQLDAQVLCEVASGRHRFPVYAISLGNPAPDAPAIGFFGGIHGLERIGAEVVIEFLRSLVVRLRWDALLHRQLETLRMVFMPLVNPAGVWRNTRANPNGVDLMRNAPVEALEQVPFLAGGQRITRWLPWYRGPRNAPMQAESLALCDLVERELLSRPFSMAVDCHSGFGLRDRIWFPFAHTSEPIRHLPEVHALKEIFDQTHAQHSYVFEPQSLSYLTHGDLWDYLYLRATQSSERVFLPLTLEMGSWLWVKKNPRQLFSRHGMFNPGIAHRQQRVLRRHMQWLDFMARAASSHSRWLPAPQERARHYELAMRDWYGTVTGAT
ncbi:M14 family zinc carboxypeptidase [Niveibacterium sp. 24ML]|uniref:M14 family zinc carboxypeptidase n=1 Tax=Niveibacterium sp. 24ML TaxID=2985512 RepID=UPI00226F5414|nr:M14 family zinc carboxypeptidase [Niveibacterium sp. 24ML]MCX9156312.1 M14 family zinc carboxypeptidase [Niveibacterium sp. 24ML]